MQGEGTEWYRLFPARSVRTHALMGRRLTAELAEELWMQDLEAGVGYYCPTCGGAYYRSENHSHAGSMAWYDERDKA